MSNPHPRKPGRKHPWKAVTQEAFDAELEAKRLQQQQKRVGYDERPTSGSSLFGSGRGRTKR